MARDENAVTDRQAKAMAPRRAQIPQTDAGASAFPKRPGLVVEGLRKAYKRRPVVRDVSLSVRRGEAVGLLGPNGAGKTTVFYMITGLIAADSGQISLDGADITHLPMYRRARLGIGYLPQEASVFRGLNVEQNVMAVLEVVKEEGMQQQALEVGEHLMDRLKKLMAQHPIIGDVRGRGLFIGVELVRDRQTKEPAVPEIDAIVEQMKDRGFLLSTDGPFHNVLKIKPPLPFSISDADDLCFHLNEVLAEGNF